MSSLFLYLVLFFGVILSGAVVFFIKKENENAQKLLLAFSGAFLLGLSFTHLIPEIFGLDIGHSCLTPGHDHGHSHGHGSEGMIVGIFVLVGFLLQLFLELLTKGIEHGHTHSHDHAQHIAPVGLMVGLCIHSFLEGMPLVDSFSDVKWPLAIGILIHNVPISMVLVTLFLNAGKTKRQSLIYLSIFALMTPLGSLFSELLNHLMSGGLEQYFRYLLAVVVGIFLHVSTSILFEASESHQYNRNKFLVVILGMGAAVLLSL